MNSLQMLAILVVLVAFAVFVLYQGEPKAELRVGMLKTVDTIHPLIAKEKGYFEAEGLDVSVHSFGTSPALAEAIAAGEIDIAYMSVVPTGIWKAKGTDIVILAGASRGGDILCTRDGKTSGKIAVSNKGTMTQTVYS
ncbi:MAG: ABC transporter substrate-binding protein, partial [candidate division Zixibacteria bacterium]|nr:ABC transporter substrate-binding protein [candidate division Zixibacteria bacterium]